MKKLTPTIKLPALLAFCALSAIRADEASGPKTLFSMPIKPGHQISDVYTPVAHTRGFTFFVIPDEQDRPLVTQVNPDGAVTSVYLDPEDDYTAFPDPHNGFSLGLDEKGYIHITGDMHQFGARHSRHGNYPYPERYDDKKDAAILYWRSRRPGNVSSGFEFRGRIDSPHRLPGRSWTYGRFLNAPDGQLFYTSRVRTINPHSYQRLGSRRGVIGFGLYRYESDTETWHAIGGDIPHEQPDQIARYYPIFYWANSGRPDTDFSYQPYQAHVNFDIHGRMHFAASGHIGDGETVRLVYAYSDDKGKIWHKANGDPIPGLPLQGDEGAANQADVVRDLKSGSIMKVVADRNSRPAVKMGQSQHSGWFVWNDTEWQLVKELPANRGFQRPNGDVLLTASWGVWSTPDLHPQTANPQRVLPGISTPSQLGVLRYDRLIGTR
ncbi:MAG: BNR repeat-containing protein, partial [Kiritimatiellae bacterium]|nr:BNR repeat-containing protein [Kiritimatiellia bacterium]